MIPLSYDINAGLVSVVATLYQNEGIRGLYRGITPELLKESTSSLPSGSLVAVAVSLFSCGCQTDPV